MGTYVFPTRLFRPPSLRASIEGASRSGGVAISGETQFAEITGGGRWAVEFGETAIWTAAKVKAWRALEAALENGATPLLVPLADRRHQPFLNPKLTTPDPFGLSIWDDEATPWAPTEITATLAADAALRAAQVSFNYAGGAELVGGEHFSVKGARWGWRMHRITRVVDVTDGVVTAEFRPPLREAFSAGDDLNFETPRCTMRLDGGMDLTIDMLRFGKASARFVETFPPET